MNPILLLDRMLRDAAAKSAKLAEARSNLPPGSSRARVTTANAKWTRAAEAREGLATRLREAVEALQDPAEIAEVLAGVLRARGVRLTRCSQEMVDPFDKVVLILRDSSHVQVLDAGQARAAIVRIAATTTAEDAVKALEGT